MTLKKGINQSLHEDESNRVGRRLPAILVIVVLSNFFTTFALESAYATRLDEQRFLRVLVEGEERKLV